MAKRRPISTQYCISQHKLMEMTILIQSSAVITRSILFNKTDELNEILNLQKTPYNSHLLVSYGLSIVSIWINSRVETPVPQGWF